MNEKYFGELVALASTIVADANLLKDELDKCIHTAKDLPIDAVRRRTQKYLSKIGNLISESQKIISMG